jgi:hypothetical protein
VPIAINDETVAEGEHCHAAGIAPEKTAVSKDVITRGQATFPITPFSFATLRFLPFFASAKVCFAAAKVVQNLMPMPETAF